MLWSKYIKVTKEGYHLLIEALGSNTIRCAGKSCNIVGGEESSNNFLCIPAVEGEKEVLFVDLINKYKFLIGIEWKDNGTKPRYPYVDITRNFVSYNSDRHVAVSGNGLDALIDGEIYTSRTDKKGDYVVDADTLCKYVALKIDADEVKSVAEEIAAKSESEEDLKKAMIEYRIAFLDAADEKDDLEEQLTLSNKNFREVIKFNNQLTREKQLWRDAVEKLSVACEKHWAKKWFCIPADINAELENIKDLDKITSD